MSTTAVTDDQGQTWTRVINGTTGTNAMGFLFKRENTAANVRKVSCVVGGVSTFINIVLIEVFNVPSSSATGLTWSKEGTVSGTAWDVGSSQTPTAGSSIYQVAIVTNVSNWFSSGDSTPGTNYKMEADDRIQGTCVAQSWEGVTATNHNPTITVATSGFWMSMAVEVLAGSGGADGPAFRCKRAVGANYSALTGTSLGYHFIRDGNLILVDTSNGQSTGNSNPTAFTGATFTQHGASPLKFTGGSISHFHADNVTSSRTAVSGTITFSAAPNAAGGGCIWFRDIIGADASPLDTAAVGSGGLTGSSGALSNTGTQVAAGNLNVGTVTPSAGTRMVTAYIDHASGSETGMSDATVNFLIPYAGQDGAAGASYTLDSGLASKIVTGAQNFTFTRSATAAGDWEVLAAAYKAASVGGGTALEESGYYPTEPQTNPSVITSF
jgi:hypothetical protein